MLRTERRSGWQPDGWMDGKQIWSLLADQKTRSFGKDKCIYLLSPFRLPLQNTIKWVAYKQQIFIPQFWSLGSPGSQCWHARYLVRACFFIDSHLFFYNPIQLKGTRELCGVSFIRPLISFIHPYKGPHDLSTSPTSYHHHTGHQVSIYEWGGAQTFRLWHYIL